MTYSEMLEVIGQCDYPDLRAELHIEHPDMGNGGSYSLSMLHKDGMRSRKWRLSTHMTRSELVQTVFLAIKTWEEHELREAFLYRGKAIFGPHLDAEVLVQIAEKLDAR